MNKTITRPATRQFCQVLNRLCGDIKLSRIGLSLTTVTGVYRRPRKPRYEILVPGVGVFHSGTIENARKRAKRERNAAARASGGPAPHAEIFLGSERVDMIW